jgi:hypothetical protein
MSHEKYAEQIWEEEYAPVVNAEIAVIEAAKAYETSLTVERLVRVLHNVIRQERGSIGDDNLLRRIAGELVAAEKREK